MITERAGAAIEAVYRRSHGKFVGVAVAILRDEQPAGDAARSSWGNRGSPRGGKA